MWTDLGQTRSRTELTAKSGPFSEDTGHGAGEDQATRSQDLIPWGYLSGALTLNLGTLKDHNRTYKLEAGGSPGVPSGASAESPCAYPKSVGQGWGAQDLLRSLPTCGVSCPSEHGGALTSKVSVMGPLVTSTHHEKARGRDPQIAQGAQPAETEPMVAAPSHPAGYMEFTEDWDPNGPSGSLQGPMDSKEGGDDRDSCCGGGSLY